MNVPQNDTLRLLMIGGSAGSLHVVLKLVSFLKKDMNLAVIIIFHRKQSEENTLVDIIANRTEFLVREIEDKDVIQSGNIYLAPPDYHVLVEKSGILSLDYSEKINFSRPSIDVTFDSGSEVFKIRSLCMLLSGANSDGVEGLKAARSYGASVVVQNPETAEVPFMPQQAMLKIEPDFLLDPSAMAAFFHHYNL